MTEIKIKTNERQAKIEKNCDCKFFQRINHDVEGIDIFLEISKIQNGIAKSKEEKLKSKFAKELLNYISSISKPLKHIRYFVEKNAAIIKMVVYDKYYLKNKEKPQYVKRKKKNPKKQIIRKLGVPLVNKIETQRPLCTHCSSRKSTFLKPIKSNKKRKYYFLNYKNIHMHCKNCKKHRGNTKKIRSDFKKQNRRKMCYLFDWNDFY